MLKYFLDAAYKKKGLSYYLISNILRSKNKLIKKHLGRRVKKAIKVYAKNTKINLGFNNAIKNKKRKLSVLHLI